MATPDPTRCGGFVAEAHHTLCERRFECARFLDNDQARPFRISACEGGDAFVHVSTVGQDNPEGNPYPATPERVLAVNTVNTTSESA